jgi:hypothetical protein
MRGKAFYNWQIDLEAGNKPEWLKPYLKALLDRIRTAKEAAGRGSPDAITIWAPDSKAVIYKQK